MDLEIEIPIHYNGKIKWISNLSSRSICSDVIQAILSTDQNQFIQSNEDYILYESWRGVERPLKSRCRLLKLWHSWAGEAQNVTLTLRTDQQQSTPIHFLIRQQDKKLDKLKRQLKRTDKQIEKLTIYNQSHENETNQSLLTYLNLYRSIVHTQTQLEYQQKLVSCLLADIEHETRSEFNEDDFTKILLDVNQTLVISRKLTEQSEQLDQDINQTNEEIDRKQYFLDELELDYALDQTIDIDSLEDEEDQDQSPFLFKQELVSDKDISPSPPLIIQKMQPVQSRPTAIVEPSLFITKSKSFSNELYSKSRIQLIPFPIRHNSPWSLSTNDESDTGISSFNSNEDQLVTLV